MKWGLLSSFLISLAIPNFIFTSGLVFYHIEIFISLLGMILTSHFYPKYILKHRPYRFMFGFGLGYFLMVYYWMPIPIYTFKTFSHLPSFFLGLFFFILNLTPLILNALLLKIFIQKDKFKLAFVPVIALVFILIEHYIPQFLPLSFGHCLLRFKATRFWASLGGVPLVTYLVYLWVLALACEIKIKQKVLLSVIFFVAYNVPPFFEHPISKSLELELTLVQPNISNDVKKRAEEIGAHKVRKEIEEKILTYTLPKARGLIVWPETAIPFDTSVRDLEASQVTPFNQVSLQKNDILTGIFIKVSPLNNHVTNSVILLEEGKLKGQYDKGQLKPFAEYFPIPFLQPLAEKIMGMPYTLKRGQKVSSFHYRGIKFSTTICYEALKGPYWANVLNDNGSSEQPSLMFNLANDNWFNQTSQPWVHYFMNQWRSLEFNIPLIRVANGGVSGIIYPDDVDFFKLPAFTETSYFTKIKFPKREKTSYQQWGLIPTLLIAFVLSSFGILLSRKIIPLLLLTFFFSTQETQANELKKFSHYAIGCDLYSVKDLSKKTFPGIVCLFSPDGTVYSANETALRAFAPDNTVKWEIPGYFHHQLNFDNDRTHILAIGTALKEENKKQFTRMDEIFVISTQGQIKKRIDFEKIRQQVTVPTYECPLTSHLAKRFNVTKEISHFNSFYQVPKNSIVGDSLLKEGNYIVNGLFQGLFIFNNDLTKVLYHSLLPNSHNHQVHDLQVTSKGKLLYFNNYISSPASSPPESSIELVDWKSWVKIKQFRVMPKGFFFSQICGGVQELDEDTWLISDAKQGAYLYSLSKKEVMMKKTYSDDFKIQTLDIAMQQVKLLELQHFNEMRN